MHQQTYPGHPGGHQGYQGYQGYHPSSQGSLSVGNNTSYGYTGNDSEDYNDRELAGSELVLVDNLYPSFLVTESVNLRRQRKKLENKHG